MNKLLITMVTSVGFFTAAGVGSDYNKIVSAHSPEGLNIDEQLEAAQEGLERRQSVKDFKSLRNSNRITGPAQPGEATRIMHILLAAAIGETKRLVDIGRVNGYQFDQLLEGAGIIKDNKTGMFNIDVDRAGYKSALEGIATLNGKLEVRLASHGIDPRSDTMNSPDYEGLASAYRPEDATIDEELNRASAGLERRKSFTDLQSLSGADQITRPTRPGASTQIMLGILQGSAGEIARLAQLALNNSLNFSDILTGAGVTLEENTGKFNLNLTRDKLKEKIESLATANGQLIELLASNGIDPRPSAKS